MARVSDWRLAPSARLRASESSPDWAGRYRAVVASHVTEATHAIERCRLRIMKNPPRFVTRLTPSLQRSSYSTRIEARRRELDPVLMLAIDVHSIQRLSRNPRPSNIAGVALSILDLRVADCLAAAKWYR
jgi:hypothetical protein